MAVYLSLPILSRLVRSVENEPNSEDLVKAMTSGILNYYFPAADGYAVMPKKAQNRSLLNFIVLRIQRRVPGDQGVFHHTFVEAKREKDDLPAALDHLDSTLEQSHIEFGRKWAVLVQGTNFMFYEYHHTLPEGERLIPWGPPSQTQLQNSFHVGNESVEIDWMLRYMAQHDIPPLH